MGSLRARALAILPPTLARPEDREGRDAETFGERDAVGTAVVIVAGALANSGPTTAARGQPSTPAKILSSAVWPNPIGPRSKPASCNVASSDLRNWSSRLAFAPMRLSAIASARR
jgi:hypothetical protein